MGLFYNVVHLLHLLLGASWVGTALAADYLTWTMETSGNRLERIRAVRQLLLKVEMPCAALVPVLGLVLSWVSPGVWQQAWLHAKLTAVVVLLLFVGFASVRNRRIIEALQAGDDERTGKAWFGYLAMRIIGWVAFAVIFIAVVFRFGAIPGSYRVSP